MLDTQNVLHKTISVFANQNNMNSLFESNKSMHKSEKAIKVGEKR